MSFSDVTADKLAKMSAMERVIASIAKETTKDVVSLQEINQATGMAVQQWLKIAGEPARVKFFAKIEISVSEAVARKIERHPLRPAATTPIVKAACQEADEQNRLQKTEAERAKRERELQRLNELRAKYEAEPGPTPVKAPKAAAD